MANSNTILGAAGFLREDELLPFQLRRIQRAQATGLASVSGINLTNRQLQITRSRGANVRPRGSKRTGAQTRTTLFTPPSKQKTGRPTKDRLRIPKSSRL